MTVYNHDFYSWAREQAEYIRSGSFDQLDLEHLAEEIDDVGSNKRSELKSRLIVLLTHLLKWHYQPGRRGRSWTLTIEEQRVEIGDVLASNPGLKPELPDLLIKAWRVAKLHAERETGLDKKVFPDVCPWQFEQIINDDFFPE